MQFVELKNPATGEKKAAAGGFEVVLASGRVVRVHAGFDAGELVRLVAALEGRRP